MKQSDNKLEVVSKGKVKEEKGKRSMMKEKDDLELMFKNKNVDMKTKVKKML